MGWIGVGARRAHRVDRAVAVRWRRRPAAVQCLAHFDACDSRFRRRPTGSDSAGGQRRDRMAGRRARRCRTGGEDGAGRRSPCAWPTLPYGTMPHMLDGRVVADRIPPVQRASPIRPTSRTIRPPPATRAATSGWLTGVQAQPAARPVAREPEGSAEGFLEPIRKPTGGDQILLRKNSPAEPGASRSPSRIRAAISTGPRSPSMGRDGRGSSGPATRRATSICGPRWWRTAKPARPSS